MNVVARPSPPTATPRRACLSGSRWTSSAAEASPTAAAAGGHRCLCGGGSVDDGVDGLRPPVVVCGYDLRQAAAFVGGGQWDAAGVGLRRPTAGGSRRRGRGRPWPWLWLWLAMAVCGRLWLAVGWPAPPLCFRVTGWRHHGVGARGWLELLAVLWWCFGRRQGSPGGDVEEVAGIGFFHVHERAAGEVQSGESPHW
nr:unnamed protein product [Digitaria exilis]